MDTRQRVDIQMDGKQRARTTIRTLYDLQCWAVRVVLACSVLLILLVAIGLITNQTAFGMFLLNDTLPWQWVLPVLLVIGFAFIFTDTFIQGREERWFMRYGTEVLATVVGSDPVPPRRWRWLNWLLGDPEEAVLRLEWHHPESDRVYTYSRRVRDQKYPVMHTRLPVIIDYDDPAYYFKEDYKDPSVKLFA